jgi:hypothetical protein
MVIQVIFLTFIQDPSIIERVDTHLISAIVREIFSLLYLGSAVKDWRLERISDCHTAEHNQNFFIKKNKASVMAALETAPPSRHFFI